MKTCTKCDKEQDVDNFAVINKKSGKIHSWCKCCVKEYDRQRYKEFSKSAKDSRKETNKVRRQNAAQYVWDYLEDHPCVDCGEEDPIVLEFDHLRDKEYNIADMRRSGHSIEAIQKEIDKCEVRCKNCHTKKTAIQFDWYKNIKRRLGESGVPAAFGKQRT